MRRQLVPALLAMVVFTALCGIAYPLAVMGVGQVAFGHQADGSLIRRDGVVVGSELLGQNFAADGYFWPRPSAAGTSGYDGASSSGSNLGPTNPAHLAAVEERIAAYREANDLDDTTDVPVDAVTASASGLDPHISVANARIQAARVAASRRLSLEDVLALVDQHTEDARWGFLGERAVSVLELNLALDDLG